jgi:hypothetical protein
MPTAAVYDLRRPDMAGELREKTKRSQNEHEP